MLGFVQHMEMSIDKLDSKRFNEKVFFYRNGNSQNLMLTGYIQMNQIYFSLMDLSSNQEWVVSSLLQSTKMSRVLRITINWVKDQFLSLHMSGVLIDVANKASTLSSDSFAKIKDIKSGDNVMLYLGNFNSDRAYTSHQISFKFLQRDYDLAFNQGNFFSDFVLVSLLNFNSIFNIDYFFNPRLICQLLMTYKFFC